MQVCMGRKWSNDRKENDGDFMILSLVAVVVMTYATVAIMAGFGFKRKGDE